MDLIDLDPNIARIDSGFSAFACSGSKGPIMLLQSSTTPSPVSPFVNPSTLIGPEVMNETSSSKISVSTFSG